VKPFSSSTLKIIAIATMVIDHVGALFFMGQPIWLIIGRLSFPLFAFLIAEGHRKTSNEAKYFFRLLLFAFISQPPYILFSKAVGMSGFPLNIFFTLAAGLLALISFKKFRFFSTPIIISLCAAAELLNINYGAYGVLTILASAVFLSKPGLYGFAVLTMVHFIEIIIHPLMGRFFNIQFFALMSVPFILLYNGSPGIKLPRRLLYWFYPVHLAILWLIWFLWN
jgi:hypothetical protein